MLALRDSYATGTQDPSSDSLALLKLWLIIIGIYIWEFATGLDYEWDVIRGRQPYRWTIWIYLATRWSTIMEVILTLVNLNVTSRMNCEGFIWTTWIFAVLSSSSGSLLLLLRIFAIWNRHRGVAATIFTIWVISVALQLLSVIRIRTVWEPAVKSCIVTNIGVCKVSMLSNLLTDTLLLLFMLAGLLRLRRGGGGTYGLWRLLWKQGVVWFVVAAVAELPPTVLMFLFVNDALDMMFVFPGLVVTAIATTRMYRSLQSYGPLTSTEPNSSDERTRNSRLVSKTKNPSVVRIPSDRLEVAVHKAYEEYPMSQMNRNDSYPDKTRELDIDDK